MSLVLDSFWTLYKIDWKNNLDNVNNSSINVNITNHRVEDKESVEN